MTVRDKCPQINVQFKWHTFSKKNFFSNGRTNGRTNRWSNFIMPQIFLGHKNPSIPTLPNIFQTVALNTELFFWPYSQNLCYLNKGQPDYKGQTPESEVVDYDPKNKIWKGFVGVGLSVHPSVGWLVCRSICQSIDKILWCEFLLYIFKDCS